MLASQLEAVEKRIRGLRIEHAYVFAPDGRLIFRKSSRKSTRVEFSDAEYGSLRGGVLTHNHPGGTSLSEQDLRLAMHAGLLQIRTVTSTHRYWVDCPPGGWSSELRAMIARAVAVERAALRAELRRAVDQHEITREDARGSLHHLLWTRMAGKAIITYGWEQWTA